MRYNIEFEIDNPEAINVIDSFYKNDYSMASNRKSEVIKVNGDDTKIFYKLSTARSPFIIFMPFKDMLNGTVTIKYPLAISDAAKERIKTIKTDIRLIMSNYTVPEDAYILDLLYPDRVILNFKDIKMIPLVLIH